MKGKRVSISVFPEKNGIFGVWNLAFCSAKWPANVGRTLKPPMGDETRHAINSWTGHAWRAWCKNGHLSVSDAPRR